MNGIKLSVMEIGSTAMFVEYDKCISDNDWIFCLIRDKKFIGSGDPDKLFTILEIFKNWAEENKE